MFLMTSGRQELLRRPPEDTITRTARRANDVPPPRYPAEESSSAPSYTPIYSHMAARRLDLDGPVPELFSEISSEAAPKYTGESDSPLAYKLGLRDFNTSTQIFQLTIQLIKKNQVLLEKIANGHVEAHQQSHPTYIALEHLNKLSKIFDTILDLLSKLNDANILKERERFEVFKLFDMAATPVGAGALLLRVHISQAIDLKGSNAATTWWVDHVRVLSKEHWRRLNDLYCMIVAEDFQRLPPKAQSSLLSIPLGRFQIALAGLVDPRFSKHFGRKITNGVDKLFNTGVPCKSRLCELDPELQRAVGFRCSCRKGTGKWESGVGVGEVGIVRRGTV